MTAQDWNASFAHSVTMALSGDTGDYTRPDDPFLLMLNAWWEPLEFTVPDSVRDLSWQIEVDTSDPGTAERVIDTTGPITLNGRSLVLLRGAQPQT